MPVSGRIWVIPKDHASTLILWIAMGEFVGEQCLNYNLLKGGTLFRRTGNRVNDPDKIACLFQRIVSGWGSYVGREASCDLFTSYFKISIAVRRTARGNQFKMTLRVNRLSRFVVR